MVVDNPEFKLAPGMFVSLDFEGKAEQEQLVVPSEAMIMTGERNVVIVAREGGGFDVAEVTLGAEAEGKTAILSGLEAGQSIVLSGQFLIDSEASLSRPCRACRRRSRSHDRGADPLVARESLPGPARDACWSTAWGVWAVLRTPLDALPDLSDVQVIIRTPYPGQAPRIVEDQITYPLTTTMMSVPGAKTVRGYSFFGDSFVYVLFEDGTDLYWARSRVLEYLNQVQSRLPRNVQPSLGPDATGVGWIYEYALVDRTGRHDLSQLRALQDWFLKYELKAVPNVAEVATLGGAVRQYQVVLDPDRLRAYGITHREVIEAIRGANQEAGGSVLELAEAEYVVRATGYLRGLDDFRKIPLAHRRRRRARAPCRCRAPAARPGAASRHRRARRRRRSHRRHHRHALRQERARNDRGRQAQARATEARPAAGRRDRRRPTTARS